MAQQQLWTRYSGLYFRRKVPKGLNKPLLFLSPVPCLSNTYKCSMLSFLVWFLLSLFPILVWIAGGKWNKSPKGHSCPLRLWVADVKWSGCQSSKRQEIKEVQFESEVCYRHYGGYLPSTCLFWTWLKLNMQACGCSRVLHLTVGFESPVGTCFSSVCALLNSYTTSKCVCWRESWLKQKLSTTLKRIVPYNHKSRNWNEGKKVKPINFFHVYIYFTVWNPVTK